MSVRARTTAIATGALAAVVAAGPVGYPVWLAWRSRDRPDPTPPSPSVWPGVTVVVAAYLEREVIAAKIDDLRANGYPGTLEVLVVADDDATAHAARAAGAAVIQPTRRQGKAAAVNAGLAAAAHPIAVITDANAMLAPGSLAALVRWFDDATVVAVAGEKRVADSSSGEGLYWRHESWLKRREFRTGTTIGLVGELAALRVAAVRPLPIDIVVDDLWLALDAVEGGGRVAYEPLAVATEDESPALRIEWERRTRNIAGMLEVVRRRRHLLHPRHGDLAAQLWGHRVVRASGGPLAHIGLLAMACVGFRRSRLARLFVLGHVGAGVGFARAQRGTATKLERLAGQVVWLQLVGAGGAIRYARGDHAAAWPKGERLAAPADRSRPPVASA